ncbi:MAG: sensor histidine kinase [Peptoclostridium sp.]|uniref:sensor histidine kinase n=1 Tax=Peptoclostridium sp. TaxID=1904860 RepID=UPI00139D0445|nr:ATP-binding protein [Peptoclostridium sp.]MZQ75101.1 sensor histidine kinase [Peptoclostridium sp.]
MFENIKRMVTVAVIVALASQIYINLFVSDFKISFGIIMFPVLLYLFESINPSQTGLLAAIFVYMLRIGIFALNNGDYMSAVDSYFPETFFYVAYGMLYHLMNDTNSNMRMKRLFTNLVICDFFSNIVELYIRINWELLEPKFEIAGWLMLVAVGRALTVCAIIVALKYYRMLVLKQNHEERYRKLLWIISQLKTELYWMEKNMDNIENVMSNAYSLFDKITNGKDQDNWAQISVNIAKDVHEIKKEYGLIFRGVEEIIENKLNDPGMNLNDIIKILKDSMLTEARIKGHKLTLEFNQESNFYTEKHYQLMSIFRNLIVNAMEAIDSAGNGRIVFSQKENDTDYIFSVADNGCGISMEDSMNIFSAGFSTKIDYNTGQINRGLGLCLVKDIVEKQLNGRIAVDSKEGQGTVFRVLIPKSILEVC